MKVTEYKWKKYLSRRAERNKEKLHTLFEIRDQILDADRKGADKLVINLNNTKDAKEILSTAGGIDYWWVIDYVVEVNQSIFLLYRNCKFHQCSDPEEIWKDVLSQLSKTGQVESNTSTFSLLSPSMQIDSGWVIEKFEFTDLDGKAIINCSVKLPSSYELSEDEHQEHLELLITQVIRSMGLAAEKPIFTWGTKIHVKDEFFLLYSGVMEHYK